MQPSGRVPCAANCVLNLIAGLAIIMYIYSFSILFPKPQNPKTPKPL